MAGGRPKKTTKDLPKNWKELILTEMAEGASRQEVTALLGISNDLYERLAKEDAEFSETLKRGLMLCEAWWLTEGRKNLKNRNFSYVGWYMNMKNRFGWKDKTEHDVSGELSLKLVFDITAKDKDGKPIAQETSKLSG